MKARVTIEYDLEWPSGLDRAKRHEREAKRRMTSCEGLRTATVKIELIDEPGWWQPLS
jgi:hypothetical protein